MSSASTAVAVAQPVGQMTVALNLVDPRRGQPRTQFEETEQQKLTASIRRLGILTPLLVRRKPNGRYEVIAGERRYRSAKGLGLTDVPVRLLEMAEEQVAEAAVVENTHRLNLDALDEANALHGLLTAAADRTEPELAAMLGMSRKTLREKLSLRNLQPKVSELLRAGSLPLDYAQKIATVPAARQLEALDQCFLPLIDKEERSQRAFLRPRRDLEEWIRRQVRLNPHSDDTAVFLPDLAEQVRAAETERRAKVLSLSTLYQHTDKSDPRPILAQSWRLAEGKERCRFARPGVIVLGDGQGRGVIQVCIAKKECSRHWPPKAKKADDSAARKAETEERAERQRLQAAAEHWRTTVRPLVLKELARDLGGAKLTTPVFRELLVGITRNEKDVAHYVGPLDKLPKQRYIGALILARLLENSWSLDLLTNVAKRFRLKVPAVSVQPASSASTPSRS